MIYKTKTNKIYSYSGEQSKFLENPKGYDLSEFWDMGIDFQNRLVELMDEENAQSVTRVPYSGVKLEKVNGEFVEFIYVSASNSFRKV